MASNKKGYEAYRDEISIPKPSWSFCFLVSYVVTVHRRVRTERRDNMNLKKYFVFILSDPCPPLAPMPALKLPGVPIN